MVQPARARAHPPPDDRHAAPRDRTGHRRGICDVSCSAGSTLRRRRACTESTGRCRSFGSWKAMRFPPFAWESQILPARVAGYRPELLDRLCYAGDVMWGRLSPHPALEPGVDRTHARAADAPRADRALSARERRRADRAPRSDHGGAFARGARDSRTRSSAARAVLRRDRARDRSVCRVRSRRRSGSSLPRAW